MANNTKIPFRYPEIEPPYSPIGRGEYAALSQPERDLQDRLMGRAMRRVVGAYVAPWDVPAEYMANPQEPAPIPITPEELEQYPGVSHITEIAPWGDREQDQVLALQAEINLTFNMQAEVIEHAPVGPYPNAVAELIEAAVRAEREACAKICESEIDDAETLAEEWDLGWESACEVLAAKIRARSDGGAK